MALSEDLKALLVCPQCRGPLEFHEERREIDCRACRLAFGIREDIPILLVDQARPLASAPAAK